MVMQSKIHSLQVPYFIVEQEQNLLDIYQQERRKLITELYSVTNFIRDLLKKRFKFILRLVIAGNTIADRDYYAHTAKSLLSKTISEITEDKSAYSVWEHELTIFLPMLNRTLHRQVGQILTLVRQKNNDIYLLKSDIQKKLTAASVILVMQSDNDKQWMGEKLRDFIKRRVAEWKQTEKKSIRNKIEHIFLYHTHTEKKLVHEEAGYRLGEQLYSGEPAPGAYDVYFEQIPLYRIVERDVHPVDEQATKLERKKVRRQMVRNLFERERPWKMLLSEFDKYTDEVLISVLRESVKNMSAVLAYKCREISDEIFKGLINRNFVAEQNVFLPEDENWANVVDAIILKKLATQNNTKESVFELELSEIGKL